MRLKTIIFLFIGFGFLLLHFTSCNTSNNTEVKQFDAKGTFAELDHLLIQLHQIDVSDCTNLDEAVSINEKMRGIIEDVRSQKEFDGLVNVFDADKYKISFLVSQDKQFGVFSWMTKMDCLGHHIKNIALYKSNNEIKTSSLYGNPLVYIKITTVELNNKSVYLLSGKESVDKKPSVTKGYTISNGDLVESQIPLPKQSSKEYADSITRY